MPLEEYVFSPAFRVYKDEQLREAAIAAAEDLFSRHKQVKRHQLHAIPVAIQVKGMAELKQLAKNHKGKKTKNADFWGEIYTLLSPEMNNQNSLFGIIRTHMLEKKFIQDETVFEDRTEQKKVRKNNKRIIEDVMNRVLPVFFEHFNCHYYMIQQGE